MKIWIIYGNKKESNLLVIGENKKFLKQALKNHSKWIEKCVDTSIDNWMDDIAEIPIKKGSYFI
jgi:hypothetical protein